jgi:prepilin-type N-terminal cleavage/methylation domain-containing protein
MSAAARRRRGFTLIELTIVVLIISILTATAAPKYRNSLIWYRVEAAGRRVADDLRYARQYARKSCKVQSVQFNVATDSYTMPSAADPSRRSGGYTVKLASDYIADISSADFGGSATFQFDVFGRPSQAGTVVLTSGGASRTIAVDSAGQVTVY